LQRVGTPVGLKRAVRTPEEVRREKEPQTLNFLDADDKQNLMRLKGGASNARKKGGNGKSFRKEIHTIYHVHQWGKGGIRVSGKEKEGTCPGQRPLPTRSKKGSVFDAI